MEAELGRLEALAIQARRSESQVLDGDEEESVPVEELSRLVETVTQLQNPEWAARSVRILGRFRATSANAHFWDLAAAAFSQIGETGPAGLQLAWHFYLNRADTILIPAATFKLNNFAGKKALPPESSLAELGFHLVALCRDEGQNPPSHWRTDEFSNVIGQIYSLLGQSCRLSDSAAVFIQRAETELSLSGAGNNYISADLSSRAVAHIDEVLRPQLMSRSDWSAHRGLRNSVYSCARKQFGPSLAVRAQWSQAIVDKLDLVVSSVGAAVALRFNKRRSRLLVVESGALVADGLLRWKSSALRRAGWQLGDIDGAAWFSMPRSSRPSYLRTIVENAR